MEVFRVLMFASTGLALVGLCFSLYREAADKNMKVITKKMSVLPQRISIVQRDFIDTIHRTRSRSQTNRTLAGRGSWARVRITDGVLSSDSEQEEKGRSKSLVAPPMCRRGLLERIRDLESLDEMEGNDSVREQGRTSVRPMLSRTQSDPTDRESPNISRRGSNGSHGFGSHGNGKFYNRGE